MSQFKSKFLEYFKSRKWKFPDWFKPLVTRFVVEAVVIFIKEIIGF